MPGSAAGAATAGEIERDLLLRVRGLNVAFGPADDPVRAVRGVDLDVRAGEVVALVGESGSGKTVSALALLGLLPAGARVSMDEAVLAGEDRAAMSEEELRLVRGARAGTVFQDPLSSLNPVQRIGDQIVEAIRLHRRIGTREARRLAVARLAQVGIPDPQRRFRDYPHQFSGGMRQRAMIAMALASAPPLLIADEPTTALDVTVQAQILDLIQELQRELSMGVLLITHDLGVVGRVADRVVVMNRGEVVERGETAQILSRPSDPYTIRLLESLPRLDVAKRAPAAAGGEPDGAARKVALETAGLEVVFSRRGGAIGRKVTNVRAVDDVSLTVGAGRTLGLVGESGCGKTTLGRAIVQLADATAGQVTIGGTRLGGERARRLRDLRRHFQLVFQDPQASLDPRQRIGRILEEPLALHDLCGGREQRRRRVVELLELVGLGTEFATRLPHELSGGQRQRIGIARALALEPSLIVLDESVSALDVAIQAQILALLERLQQELGIAYVFISHDLAVVRQIADTVAVMYLGRVVESGPSEQIYREPRHPYTAALLSAVPIADVARERARERIVLHGDPPSPADPPSGCAFHTRCWLRSRLGDPEICTTARPALGGRADGGQHRAACHFSDRQAELLPPSLLGATRGASA
ncbi:ABC transporter ATP-binding protein [Conexibacter sp. JD483]|uniref:dipeptide ABC transporter ATP-binding protein n=1 Tax=unclassified Conexibacter TaxID=2627773 RepID=UPI00271E214A|nr:MULTISPECIES: ABC transporter ATP-binding protein [unclassified Conexibacter]MDO8187649.1 ABC transporter ATP-binding protein [Conexibacter sp. CPCC 205706]MDO8199834.1 ABC transporter ATP-binding protein [Conexibacter sp. CPCC 205762]MDR9370211.1 ABC transporter ATP-binding protein [Conexibacter sp. JD483]